MSIKLLSATVTPNQSTIFSFDQAISEFAVGISYFELTFGNTDHHVRDMSVSLSVTRPAADQITVTAHAVLNDGSGHSIDGAASKIGIVCLGALADAPATLANCQRIPSGGVSSRIPAGDFQAASQAAYISGYQLGFGSSDHHVERAHVGVGLASSGNYVTIGANANMSDGSGHNAQIATVDAGYEAFATVDGVDARVIAHSQSATPVLVKFDAPVASAVALIQTWRVAFQGDRDHHTQTISAGTTGWSIDQNIVQLNDAQATLRDASGNVQSNADSGVTMLILGLIAKP